jgi:beta-mannanase
MINSLRTLTENSENIEYVWSPASGEGYPFAPGKYSAKAFESAFDIDLDHNRDGVYDDDDDPYSPYYPGDEFVDWIGISVFSN